uniref:Putative lipocalin-5 1 n=1 Tax=Amblyomma triste TaxID=251400 RepID=A0A023GDJ2_AMBTT
MHSSSLGMRSLFSMAMLGVYSILLALPTADCEVKEGYKNFPFDAFKRVADFDDIEHDGDLDCLTLRRTVYDQNGPSATYVWMLAGLGGTRKNNGTLHVRSGSEHGKPVFTVGNGHSERTLIYVHTEYEHCTLFKAPYNGREECAVWMTDVTGNNPQHCLDTYEEHCAYQNASYDIDICRQYVI